MSLKVHYINVPLDLHYVTSPPSYKCGRLLRIGISRSSEFLANWNSVKLDRMELSFCVDGTSKEPSQIIFEVLL